MKLPLVIAVCAGLVMAGAVQAMEVKINQTFTGVTTPTMVDTNGDGAFANDNSFQIVGSPGRATATSIVESTPIEFVGTPGCELRSEIVTNSFIETFNDGSMLFFWVEDGFMCIDTTTSEIWGELAGIVTGGKDRFEGATGEFIVEFKAILATPTQNAFFGTMKGTVEIPR
jgi:hypothetical protein